MLLVTLWVGTGACARPNRSAEKFAQDTEAAQTFDSNLTFNNVTLQEADEKGQLWWKVKAKQATYSEDKRNAVVVEPKGELYQDGKPIYTIEAQKSEIQQDGKSIVLKGAITATAIKDGSVFKGNEIEWRPTENVMFIRDQFTGTHKQMQIAAKQGRFLTREDKVDISGSIVATLNDPQMKLQTEHLIWDTKQENIVGDRPIQLERYQNKVVSDRGGANAGDVDLKTKIVTLRGDAKITANGSNLNISGNLLTWNIDAQTLNAPQPVTIVNPVQQTTITANAGSFDLQQNVARLEGNVRGNGEKNQSQLTANQVTWFLDTQQFQAEGNVNYNQQNPPFKIAGPKASGKLDDQQVAVSGNSSSRVELEIVPQVR
nr:LPS export ABC transporter periplasmic protein LptC [Myxacorys almedinensis]